MKIKISIWNFISMLLKWSIKKHQHDRLCWHIWTTALSILRLYFHFPTFWDFCVRKSQTKYTGYGAVIMLVSGMLPCLSPPSPPTPLKLWLFLKRSPRREPSRGWEQAPLSDSSSRTPGEPSPGQGGGASSPHQIRCAIILPGPGRHPFCQQRRLTGKRRWGVAFASLGGKNGKQTLSSLARSLGYNVRDRKSVV